MKRLLWSLMLLAALNAQAQERKWEHRFSLGAGITAEREDGRTDNGLALRAGYALAYNLSEQWSLMAGLAIRDVSENTFGDAMDGADDDHFTFLDLPLVARYHVGQGKGSWALGLGPVLSYCISNDTYYIDADPQSPLNYLDKSKRFVLGLQPAVTYRLSRHWELGVEANIGLTNIKDGHGLTSGSKHIHYVMATIGVVF